MEKVFALVQENPQLTQNTQEKIEELKWEIGDKYIREYLQTLQLDQKDPSVSLAERLRAETEVQVLPHKIAKVAKYCVAVHASAQLLKAYDQQYGAEVK